MTKNLKGLGEILRSEIIEHFHTYAYGEGYEKPLGWAKEKAKEFDEIILKAFSLGQQSTLQEVEELKHYKIENKSEEYVKGFIDGRESAIEALSALKIKDK